MSSGIVRAVRLAAGAGDQYLFALTNLIPSIAVARSSDVGNFAAFSACFLIYVLFFGASKAAFSETAAMRNQRENSFESINETARALVRYCCVTAAPAFLALMLIAVVPQWSNLSSSPLLWVGLIGLAFPFHALHDLGRTVFIATRKPIRPLISDAAWFAIAAIGFFPFEFHPIAWATSFWALGGIAACVIVYPPSRVRGYGLKFLWSPIYSLRSLAEYLMQSPVMQGSILLCGLVGSASSLAALRGGTMLFRPIGLLVNVHRVLAFGSSRDRRGKLGSVLFMGLAASTGGTLLFAALLWFLPDGFGRAILGPTWPLVHAALVPLALAVVFDLVSYVFVTDIKAHGIVEGLLRIRIVGVVAIPLFTVLGAISQDPTVTAWGFCVGQAFGAAWVARQATVLRRGSADLPAEG